MIRKAVFVQECPQPCTRLGIVAKLVGRELSPSHQINLIFAPEVEVTKSVLTVSGINLISNLGGILGLMLGLGLLQIAELLDRGLDILMDFLREKRGYSQIDHSENIKVKNT